MLTYPKSTMRVRGMPMHLSSGHVTDAGEILPSPLYPPPNFLQSDFGRRADSRWLCPKFLVLHDKTAVLSKNLLIVETITVSAVQFTRATPTRVDWRVGSRRRRVAGVN